MSKERLYLFDTTLRDGAQTAGIDFTLDNKLTIIAMLEELGLDYIEGGYPGANDLDSELFSKPRETKAKFTAFGMTKRAGYSAENDPGLQDLLNAKSDAICFVAKSWDYHVKVALNITNEENLESIAQSVEATIARGKEALIDCEHFFDGYKSNPDYAVACVKSALDAGARWAVLCDTNGGTMPEDISEIISALGRQVPLEKVGIHAHNDTGQAVANSLAAVRAGVRQIQGTLNGIGERCGNANLTTLIPTLLLKPNYANQFDINISMDNLKKLRSISLKFDELLNRASDPHRPYVGKSAFTTKAGIHASALLKDPSTYEHVKPECVGNIRQVLVSDQAGKSNLLAALKRIGLQLEKDDPRLTGMLAKLKEKEAAGYSYEAADASFSILIRRYMNEMPSFFDVVSFQTIVERRFNARGQIVTVSEAIVKVNIGDEQFMSVAEGNGPVNALDNAIRKDLGQYTAQLKGLELIDFKVRILDGGTEAVTRVVVESRDEDGERWTTIGVSSNIIDASFEALLDSINYKLLKMQ